MTTTQIALSDEATAIISKSDEHLLNSLSDLCIDIFGGGGSFGNNISGFPSVQTSGAATLFINNRWYLISNMRQLLSQLYVEHGIVQTLVDQPVEDSFRSGYTLKSGQLSDDDREKLTIADWRLGLTEALKGALKWGRLYGGGAVIVITDQDPYLPLDLDAINPDTPLEFRAVDMWELFFGVQNTISTMELDGEIGANLGDHYDYYGIRLHKSRVYRVNGKEAPSFIRPRLRGWGMSELERIVRSLNQFMKNQDVIFSLLDEAKVDVYRIKGFNSSLLNTGGTQATSKRIQLANMLKSFNSALVMDKEDEYDQKQITFAGLADVLLQIRQGIAADLKMPMTKIFGISAAGFNSGEDDIENYNSMLESEIRQKARFMHVDLLQIACRKCFGIEIDDLMLEYNPLRILNAKEEEEVKDSQFNRVMSAYQSALIDDEEAKNSMNSDSLLPIEVDPKKPAGTPLEGEFTVGGAAKGGAGKKTPSEE